MTKITMYKWGGEKFGFKIKTACEECDLNEAILGDMRQKEFKGWQVEIAIKPWLTNFWEALRLGGWHAPVIAVDGKLFSQGVVVNRKKLTDFVAKKNND